MTKQQARLELRISVFEKLNQKAFVLPGLKPVDLIEAILQEFQELEYLGNNSQDYRLLRYAHKEDKTYLKPQLPLGQQLKNGDQVFLVEVVPKDAARPDLKLYLREQAGGQVYKLHHLPAMIGRQDKDGSQPEAMAVNLEGHPQGLRVSRCQAKISEEAGNFFLEPMSSNPTLIKRDHQTLAAAAGKQQLLPGDIIWLQRSSIELKFIVRGKHSSLTKEPAAQEMEV